MDKFTTEPPSPRTNATIRLIREEDAVPYDTAPKQPGGFALTPRAVLDLKDGYCTGVYATLAGFANAQRECWPSIATLMAETGWSSRHLRTVLEKMERAGVIEIERRFAKGMRSSSLYRLGTIKAEVTIGMECQTFGMECHLDRHGVPLGLAPGANKLEPRELEPRERDDSVPAERAKGTPLPMNGAAQQIVAAYCREAGIERPAMYAKAVGLAGQMVKAGVTPEDIPSLYAFVVSWSGTADLGLMLNQIDRWRATPRTMPRATGRPVSHKLSDGVHVVLD